MPTGIFEFQTMLTSAVNGISGSILGTEQSVSYVLMTICLVLGIYEAYTRGGDLRSLAGTLLKYAVAAFLIGNWTAFFSDAYSGFNQLASAIDSSYGAVDLAKNWTLQLQYLFQTNGYDAMFKAIPWTPPALLTLVEIALAYIIYPIAQFRSRFHQWPPFLREPSHIRVVGSVGGRHAAAASLTHTERSVGAAARKCRGHCPAHEPHSRSDDAAGNSARRSGRSAQLGAVGDPVSDP